MANKRIDKKTRGFVLSALSEGMAINSICRMLKVGKHAVLRLIEETGEACEDWHHRHFQGLSVARVELDEMWSYVHTHKEKLGMAEARDNPEKGDCWLFTAIDADSKAILSWRTGKRTFTALRLAADLASRIDGDVQITSDLFVSYAKGVHQSFGNRAHYATEEKIFHPVKSPPHQWLVQKVNPLVKVKRKSVFGRPNLATSTVCHMERFYLTMRQGNKRTARKTLAYSKKWSNHGAATSIHIFLYNLCRVHESLKKTPAVALGVADHRWSLEDVVNMTEAYHKAKEEAAFEAAFNPEAPAFEPVSFTEFPKRRTSPAIPKLPRLLPKLTKDDPEPPERWLIGPDGYNQ